MGRGIDVEGTDDRGTVLETGRGVVGVIDDDGATVGDTVVVGSPGAAKAAVAGKPTIARRSRASTMRWIRPDRDASEPAPALSASGDRRDRGFTFGVLAGARAGTGSSGNGEVGAVTFSVLVGT